MYMLILLILCTLLGICIETLYRKLRINRFDERFVLITGCDSGFGNCLAKQLDVLGFHVFACCLTNTAVDELNGECSQKVVALQMDVSKDESIGEAMQIVKRKIQNEKGLWALVNNAGAIGTGPTSWQTRQDYENVMAVNLYGPIMVTKACMPLLMKEGGRVINIPGLAGRIAFGNPTYSVSKYGLEAFSDTLRRENYNTGVSVHIIEPGFFKTRMMNKDLFKELVQEKFEKLPSEMKASCPIDVVDRMTKYFSHLADKVASPNVADVVDAYIHAITAQFPKKRYVVGFDARFIFQPLLLMPEWISDWIVFKIHGALRR